MTQGVHDIVTGEIIDETPMTPEETQECIARNEPLIAGLEALAAELAK